MNNTVTFKVAGNDVLAFMDQVRKKNDATTAEMIANAKKQSGAAKDQLKDIEAQIKALEKKNKLEADAARMHVIDQRNQKDAVSKQQYENKVEQIREDKSLTRRQKADKIGEARDIMEDNLSHSSRETTDQLKTLREQERLQQLQTKLLHDNIDTIRATSDREINNTQKTSKDLADELSNDNLSDSERLAKELALSTKQSDERKEKDSSPSIMGALMSMDNLKSLMGSVSGFAGTQNGFDMVQPGSKGVGNIVGSILGGIVGAFAGGVGALAGAGIGGQIGSMFGDTIGQFEQRRLLASQEFLGSRNKYEATTQSSLTDIPNLSAMGVSAGDYINVLREIAINTGNAAMAATNTKDVIEMEKGLGVGKEVSSQMIQYFRGSNKDIGNLVQGIMTKGKSSMFQGGDYTFLNEFLQKFNTLHNELRNTSEKVATGTTFDILDTFNKIGGQYSSRDPRSQSLISSLNGSLVNPGSSSLQAMSFLALRKDNPNMSYAQLMEEKQKGLASPSYLKSMLALVDQYGGDRSAKIANLTSLTGGNFAAARRLYDGKGNVHRMSIEEVENNYTGDFQKAAESKTTVIESNMASIKNGLLSTWGDGVDAMVDSFSSAMTQALNGAVIQIGTNGRITMGTIKVNPISNNVSKVATPDKGQSFDNKGYLHIGQTNHK